MLDHCSFTKEEVEIPRDICFVPYPPFTGQRQGLRLAKLSSVCPSVKGENWAWSSPPTLTASIFVAGIPGAKLLWSAEKGKSCTAKPQVAESQVCTLPGLGRWFGKNMHVYTSPFSPFRRLKQALHVYLWVSASCFEHVFKENVKTGTKVERRKMEGDEPIRVIMHTLHTYIYIMQMS
jgi:hypothetical protein